MVETLTIAQARRIALAAQALDRPRPKRAVTKRDITSLTSRLAQFQIDSVNVLSRAHYMPAFSRLGPYDRALLDNATGSTPLQMFEYWGHAASYIDVELWPALGFRMAANR